MDGARDLAPVSIDRLLLSQRRVICDCPTDQIPARESRDLMLGVMRLEGGRWPALRWILPEQPSRTSALQTQTPKLESINTRTWTRRP